MGVQVTGLQEAIQRLQQASTRLAQIESHVTRELTEAVAYAKMRYLSGGTTADRLAIRTGALMKSFAMERLGAGGEALARWRIGYLHHPPIYASVHEGWPDHRRSTTIRARNAQYLTIPLPGAFHGPGGAPRRARDVPNTFVARSRRGNLLIFARGAGNVVTPLYLLKREVVIPARPALTPTMMTYLPRIRALVSREGSVALGVRRG